MIFAESDRTCNIIQIQVIHIVGIYVIHHAVEFVHIFLLLVDPHIGEQIDVLQMVGADLHKHGQQQ